jgi:hypothetical protein
MGHKPHLEKEKLINQKNNIIRIYVGFVKKKNLCTKDSENLEEQMQYAPAI